MVPCRGPSIIHSISIVERCVYTNLIQTLTFIPFRNYQTATRSSSSPKIYHYDETSKHVSNPRKRKFISIQQQIASFEHKYIKEVETLIAKTGDLTLSKELHGQIRNGGMLWYTRLQSALPSEFEVERHQFDNDVESNFDNLYKDLVGKFPPDWVKQENRKKAMIRAVERGQVELSSDKYIEKLRENIVPSISQPSSERKQFLIKMGECENRSKPSPMAQLLELWDRLPKPALYSLRRHERKALFNLLIAYIKAGKITSKRAIPLAKSVFEEMLDESYGLKHAEYDAYCKLLKKLSMRDNYITSLKSIQKCGVQIDFDYVSSTLRLVDTNVQLNELSNFLVGMGPIEERVSFLLLTKRLQFCNRGNDLDEFMNVLQLLTDSYRLRDFATLNIMKPILDGLLSYGFYSSPKRILMTLLKITGDPLEGITRNEEILVSNLLQSGFIPRTYILSKLRPRPANFINFFKYLVRFSNSKNEIDSLLELMLANGIKIPGEVFWLLCTRFKGISNYDTTEIVSFIKRILGSKSFLSWVPINKFEYDGLIQLFSDCGFRKRKKVNIPRYHPELTRLQCINGLVSCYDIRS